MKEPLIPEDEAGRLSSLKKLDIVYSPAEERFDRITRLARRTFNVPIALVSLITQKCQWFKSAQGLLAPETSREISFCGHAILGDKLFIVPDTLLNPDFTDNPLVTGAPYIRFYAGCPVNAENGNRLGTLCIIDTKPRTLSLSEQNYLETLADWVEHELRVSALNEGQLRLIRDTEEMERKALIDPVTRTWSREGVQKLFEREKHHAREFGLQYSFLLIDVDNFSELDGQYGTGTGDIVLSEVAQRARTIIRPEDAIARYGGHEFLILLEDCEERHLTSISERISNYVTGEAFVANDESCNITVSIGSTTKKNISTTSLDSIVKTTRQSLRKAQKSDIRNTELA